MPETPPKSAVWILLGALVAFAAIVVGLLYKNVIGPGLMSNVVRTRQSEAQTQILELSKALEAWSAHHEGNYPSSLAALIEPDAQGHTLFGDARVLPKDPWGHDFVYASPGPGALRPMLRSLGRDGQAGGAAEDADVDREGLVPEAR